MTVHRALSGSLCVLALAACAPTATAGRRGAAYESAALRAIGEDDVQRAFDERPELA
ncbi:MAG: hypothetical protein IT373_04815, partial [Polyangiaceae bacterium]|nr:hypothetical protein [Polyangiaceae bacterium]